MKTEKKKERKKEEEEETDMIYQKAVSIFSNDESPSRYLDFLRP